MSSSDFETEEMRPIEAWCDDRFLYVTLADGRQIRAPLWWYPFLARATASDRAKVELMFEDILPGETFIPLPRAANVPHRVMAFEIESGEARWTRAKHPLLDFFCNTDHPDIDVSQVQDIGVGHRHPLAGDWLGAPSR